jgi:hypothetical protein
MMWQFGRLLQGLGPMAAEPVRCDRNYKRLRILIVLQQSQIPVSNIRLEDVADLAPGEAHLPFLQPKSFQI